MKKHQKIALLLLAVVMVFVMMPQVAIAAEDGYAYEIAVDPQPVTAGGEVTVTVRLTDYDETKSGIRGFQIDINNAEEILQNSVCRSLVTDKENVLSDVAAYQPSRDLVRHLYAKMNGTMSYDEADLLEVKIPIPDTYTEAGVISLPFRILIQNAAGGKFTYTSTVEISYVPATSESSVDLTWGAMDFTYNDGTWQPDTHTYSGGGWTANDNSNYVTVTNSGETDVSVRLDYVSEIEGVTGSFSDGTNDVSEAVSIGTGNEKTYYLLLSGKPGDSALDKAVIGHVTVSLE